MNLKKEFFSKYEFLFSNNIPCIVGLGANSSVQLAIDKKTQQFLAVKKIQRKTALKQASIHSLFKHPNIVEFRQLFYDSQTNSSFMVLEYASNGTLSQYMNKSFLPNEINICKFVIQICRGLQMIHSAQVIHRDLKPSNILFDSQWNLKICDFGSAIDQAKSQQFCGTFEYLAPEILCQKIYDSKVDVWALGIIIYELLEGKLPFKEKNTISALRKMQQPLQFQRIHSKGFIEIIRKMLNFDPKDRPEITQVKRFLQKIQKTLIQKQNHLMGRQILHQRTKTSYQSQNSTLDSNEDQNQKLIIRKSENQMKPQKTISLKNLRSSNSNKQNPKIKILKPTILNQKEISSPKKQFNELKKISIRQILKKRNRV